MTSLAPTLEAYFTDRLIRQRRASPHTIASYRDTFRLLLGYIDRATSTPTSSSSNAPSIASLRPRAARAVTEHPTRCWPSSRACSRPRDRSAPECERAIGSQRQARVRPWRPRVTNDDGYCSRTNDRMALFSLAHGLSKREAEIMAACARGTDTRGLAQELFVSENTIQDHFKSIFAKTGTRTRGELLALARGG
jgi:DNA-binding CsgD family transcriptional regulator